jgi:hypothetical protein
MPTALGTKKMQFTNLTIVLLLSEEHPWSLIASVLFCSTATIARWKARCESGGVDALLEEKRVL